MKHDSKKRPQKKFSNPQGRRPESNRPSKPEGGFRLPSENIITGRRALEELLRVQPERVLKVFLRVGVELSNEIRELLSAHPSIPTEEIESQQFHALPHADKAQGVMAHVRPLEVDLKAVLDQSLSPQGNGVIVVCDQITDPHNLGAVLRAAEASGADAVLATVDRSSPLTPVVRKASAGASELLPLVFVQNLQRTLEMLRDSGYWIYGAALDDASVSVFSVEFSRPFVLVVGSEGAGLRPLTKKLCHQLLKIPMPGRINSLNVSQATSVLLYEALRQSETAVAKA